MSSPFARRLSEETLDHLREDDPRAVRSRQDLQRINRIMGSAGIIAQAWLQIEQHSGRKPQRIIELGAGDGSLMLRLAQKFAPRWPSVHLTLLDRQQLVSQATRDAFARLGWSVDTVQADVTDWAAQADTAHWDIGVVNLFIHHFDAAQIARLFDALSKRTDAFIACEPRRAKLPLIASRMVGLIGANDVTREDAVLSVQAGFCGKELSALWPAAAPRWQLDESSARLFTHRFVAMRAA